MDRKAAFVSLVAGLVLAAAGCSSMPSSANAAKKSVAAPRAAGRSPMALTRGVGPALAPSVSPKKSAGNAAAPSIEVRHSIRNVTSRPLSEVGRPPQAPPGTELRDIEMEEGPTADLPLAPRKRDPVLQRSNAASMPSPLVNFEGTANENHVQPADTTMAIGPDHIVQWVNLSFQIYDKAGVSLAGPFDGNTLFTDLGGDCAAINGGDIIVMYDQLADRWFLSQLAPAIFGAHGNHQCMAVSTSGDPLGSYYLYDYLYSETLLNDYPHFGTWPDAYYMTVREFGGGFTMTVTAFDRQAMLNGQPLTAIFVSLNNHAFDGLLPADLDGPNPPPGGSSVPPEVLMGVGTPDTDGSPDSVIHMYFMHPDFATPSNSTFTGPTDLPISPFNYVPFFYGVPEPVGAAEALGWVLYRLPYRNYGTHESLVLHHDVLDDANRVVPRWYEIRDPYGTPTLLQEGTFAPADGVNRWMGAIAMDSNNNIAMGYSVSNTTTPPGIRYAGRLATDPLGELTQGETELVPGAGSFLGSRWGDYSTLDVDPVDDCTFWYTTMYVGLPGVANWQTRIGSFKFPSCSAPTFGTVEGSVTDGTDTLAGAHVVVAGGGGGGGSDTDASGHYTFDVPAGTYSLTATRYGFFPTTVPNVVVAQGGDTVQDFVLTAAPPVNITGNVRDSSGGNWPLYAKIVITTARGPILTVFTDPATGNYSIPLVTAAIYNFHVTAVSTGYGPGSAIVTAQAGVVADFSLNVDPAACVAPGYSGPPCVAGAGGLVVGDVLDANTGLGLNGAAVADLPQPGSPSTTTFATPEDSAQPDGFYILFAAAGSQSIQAALDRYTSQTKGTTIVAHDAVRLDFGLAAGRLDVAPRPLSARVNPGEIVGTTLDLTNAGGSNAGFELVELTVPPPFTSAAHVFADPVKRQAALDRIPEGRLNGRDTAGLAAMPGAPQSVPLLAGGNVLNSYPTSLIGGWGIAFDTDATDFWVSNSPVLGGDGREYRYLADGTPTGGSIDDSPWVGDFAADGAFNARTGMLWRVNVGGDNCIYELDPVFRVATGNKICGSPWTAVSQRGLAYDVATDTYYVGGPSEGVIYHIDATGAVLDSTSVAIPISGLAYNGTTGHVFAMTNHGSPPNATFDVFVFDARHAMNVVGAFNVTQNGQPLFDFLHFGGAGMEIDCDGHLWLVDQVGQLIWEVESGESHVCAFNEIPWLAENPTQGTVSASSAFPVACTFDSTGLSPGLRQGQLKVVTDTPYAVAPVPVDFTVRFLDVPDSNIFESFIYGAAGAGVMPGCDPAGFLFCPSALVTRADMAGFILRAVHGASFVPTPYAGAFNDVQAGDYNADYIQSFFEEGYTAGCGGGNYCPGAAHTRGQTAVFILKGTHGPSYVPPACASTHVFDDVPCPATPGAPFGDWIGQLYSEQITAGCGGNDFCPGAGIPNEQMATFLVKAFQIPR
jgi:hypothetical protein